MILADLHVHSTFSDGKMTISELVDFYGTRGFGCIAITDHVCEQKSFLGFAAGALKFTLSRESFPKYLEMIHSEAERAWKMYRLRLIPGYELSKNSWSNQRSAHILGLGVSKWIPAESDILEMTRDLRAQGALSIAAHPVHTGIFEPQTLHLWSRREELREEFDAWEVASGRKYFEDVHHAGVRTIATSDLHHAKQVTSWKTLLKVRADDPSTEAILEAVRDQKLEFGFWNDAVRQVQKIRSPESSTATRQSVKVASASCLLRT
jgi:hypothetical protein